MENPGSTSELVSRLKREKIKTWFDLGIFLDRLKEENNTTIRGWNCDEECFKEELKSGGVAFISFHYMVDGVTVEAGKYAALFEQNFPGIPIHFIAGEFRHKSQSIINNLYKRYEVPELVGFDDWDLYEPFFLTELERGSTEYNGLIRSLWDQTLRIIATLGSYIEKEGIRLLYVINVCSNPGNVAAALALALLSEYLELPVINNNHDFYFEGGSSRFERKAKGLKKGPRDFFYTNVHLGEIFSLIEMLYPWESKFWINVNINTSQTERLIRYKGHNPARVTEIGTAVDTGIYVNNDKRRNISAFLQFEKILSRYRKQLISYSVDDVVSGELVSESNPKPILIGNKTRAVHKYSAENIIFLQPTRIITRKRIELGFDLLQRIFQNEETRMRFASTRNLKITLLVSGPIATGHYDYYRKLLTRFKGLLENIPEEFRNRIFLALLLGELDRKEFLREYPNAMRIPDLYNISSLVLLPSKTEGRGLPIIEATACGTPIFCRRYQPEEVYSEVIGEHLREKDRLKVYEFKGKKISKKIVSQIIDRVFFPHKYVLDTKHNKRIVEKRYSLAALNSNLLRILGDLYHQIQADEETRKKTIQAIEDYSGQVQFRNEDLDYLLPIGNRHYMPGYGRTRFMIMLKSLIDPSYFRVEEQLLKGSLYFFAREILHYDKGYEEIPIERRNTFYNSVQEIFNYVQGEVEIRHDHSMSYRHRNRRNYPFQQYTFQELTGLVNLLYLRIVQPDPKASVELSPQFFTDWNLAIQQLTGSKYLAIDNRDLLIKKLKSNLPIAYFPGEFIMYELEFFALQAMRSRLDLPLEIELSRELLEKRSVDISPVYIFAQKKKLGKQLSKDEIINFIKEGKSQELKLLYEFGLIRIIPTSQLCVGIHFPQLGAEALSVLTGIRKKGGFLLTNRRHAALMTDIVNMDRFHIGRVRGEMASGIMGIPEESGYIQYVPAGQRTTITFPTPVQTAREFNDFLTGDRYRRLEKKIGAEQLSEKLFTEAEKTGAPISVLFENIDEKRRSKVHVETRHISGIYPDGNPYSGVEARIDFEKDKWDFCAVSTQDQPKAVSRFVEEFEDRTGKKAEIAWNGGYILNAELVGKLGLPESYIGSPLGLLISEGECLCPPLFNKAALLIDQSGKAKIQKVSCRNGIRIITKNKEISLGPDHYNLAQPGESIAYYDLMYPDDKIHGHGRTIVRLAGRTVKEVIQSNNRSDVPLIPVGITLSFPPGMNFEIQAGEEIGIVVYGLEQVRHAIEAGPLLVSNGHVEIDMENEGWIHKNSIATQAARLDYTDMRGPKIAVGMNSAGEISVLTINGRIRESVGATHSDMANILLEHGMTDAMGFDPGGSSTLCVGGKTLNISPYNKEYEYNVYSLPPQSRAVSNAVIGYLR